MTDETPGRGLEWTDEQAAILACEARDVVIRALAGTGKTSTLREFARRRPGVRFLYLVFNKEAQLHAARSFPPNVQVSTIHSVAWRATAPALTSKRGEIFPAFVARAFGARPDDAKAAIDMVNRFCGSAARRVEQAALRRDSARALEVAEQLWAAMKDPRRRDVPLTHDGYLKLFVLDGAPLGKFDALLVDEAQDLNPATTLVIAGARGMRRVMVGDSHQSIYRFRGAVDAMDLLDGEMFPLTGSFRFGPSVARAANAVLAQKGEALELRGLGGPSRVVLGRPSGRCMFLSRTNAGALLAAAASPAKHLHFAGGLDSYRAQRIMDAFFLWRGWKERVRDREIRFFESLTQMEAFARETDGVELSAIAGFVRQAGDQTPAVIADLEARAVDAVDEAGFLVSTAHKAKGLEFEEVALGDFFAWEDYVAKREQGLSDSMAEELNLLYVAATRAEKVLYVNDTLAAAIAEYEGAPAELVRVAPKAMAV